MKTLFAGIRLDVLLVLAINTIALSHPSAGLGVVVLLALSTPLFTVFRWDLGMARAGMRPPEPGTAFRFWLFYVLFVVGCGLLAGIAFKFTVVWLAYAAALLPSARKLSREVNATWACGASKAE